MESDNILNIKKAVEAAEIISFDVFDTLIVRLTAKAEDVFRIMEHKTGISGFAREREQQQTKCSIMIEQTKGEPHCTFDDIYDYLEKNSNLDVGKYSWQQLKALELEVEKQVLICNLPMSEVYQYAKKLGKRVILTSDMYLGAAEILPLLENCGYSGFDSVYVSADVKKTKYRLDLFTHIAKAEGVMPDKILHIGDNLKDDVENAKKCGLNSVHYNGNRNKAVLPLYQSIATGVGCAIRNCDDSFWYNLGASVGGPLYCGLIKSIKHKIAELKPEKVFFLARDGYNLYEIAKNTGIIDIDCEYFYASRRAMLLCGIDTLDDTAKAQLPPFTFGQSVKDILTYLDMPEVSEESVRKCGFSGFDAVIETKSDFVKFRKIFDLNSSLFFEKAAEERKCFENYLNKTGFLNTNSLVFDCGWNGSSQFLLDRAVSLMPYKGSNSFIYAGLMNTEKCRRQLSGKSFDTILFGTDTNQNLCKRLVQSIVLLELFFGAPHGSVWKYADNEQGFIEEKIEKEFEYKNEILRGITDFVKLAFPLYETLGIVPTAEDCLAQVFRLIEHPTVDEAVKIGDLENVDGFVAKQNQKKYIARLTPEDIKLNPNELYWPQGIYTRPDIADEVKNYVKGKTGVKMSQEKETPSMPKRPNVVKRLAGYVKSYGLITTAYLVKNRLKADSIKMPFDIFVEKTETEVLKTQPLDYKPLFSFVVPVYNVLDWQLRDCIDSILNQTYDNFELILVDDKSTWESVPKVLAEYEENPKITVIYRQENGHISRCTNTGIEAAKGEYIVFTDCDDVVAPNAVYEMTRVVNEDKSIDFIYSDEDKLTDDGKRRHFPHFKPDWSPDTFMSHMYTSHLSAYRRSIVNEIGGLRVGFEGAQDYDFTIRFTEKTNRVAHIPKILYHWRQRPESTASDLGVKPYVMKAMLNLKTEALERRGLKGEVIYEPEVFQYRVIYDAPDNPLVSIIIPSKDNYEMLERCVRTLTEKTEYKNYEIVVVDNGSNDENRQKYQALCQSVNATYHYEKMQFNFSKMCNLGAGLAKGDYLLFLNDDIEVVGGGWLRAMLGQASLEHTGAVGAKLLYPDSSAIQHCGIINLQRGPCHALCRMDDRVPQYFCRNKLEYNYIAVTAACLCVSREKFNLVNGFDEELTVGYNDVDLCFKLHEQGLYNTVRNDAILYHYESVSRGLDSASPEKQQRLNAEMDRLYKKHPSLRGTDPYYNVNLVKDRVDFDIDITLSVDGDKIAMAGFDASRYLNGRAKACLDSCNKGGLTEISGWAFIAAMPLNNLNKRYVLLVDENNNALAFETRTMLRFDVTSAFGKGGNLNLSGFNCSIKTENLQAGKYQVGVLVKNPVTRKKSVAMFDEYIIVE